MLAEPQLAWEDNLKMEEKDEKARLTIYLSKPLLKKFKHRAIDEDKELSQLAEEIFTATLNASDYST